MGKNRFTPEYKKEIIKLVTECRKKISELARDIGVTSTSVSRKSAKAFRDKLKALNIHHRTGCKIEMLAELLAPLIRGWLNYYGRFNFSAVKYTMDWVNRRLIKWAMCKYKRFKRHQHRTGEWLRKLAKREPNMFFHWTLGILP